MAQRRIGDNPESQITTADLWSSMVLASMLLRPGIPLRQQDNKRLRVVIADGDPLTRRGIRQLLESHKDIDIIAETLNGRETVRALHELKPDLVFLDIQMPSLDALGVLEAIGAKQMSVAIIVTAHDRGARRAFEAQTRNLSALGESEIGRQKQRIIVQNSTGNVVIPSHEILWIEADNYYAAIYARKQRHLVRESLLSLAQRLDPSRFIRVHRSAIVNLDRVEEVRNIHRQTFLVLSDGTEVPVSRRRRSATRRILGGLP